MIDSGDWLVERVYQQDLFTAGPSPNRYIQRHHRRKMAALHIRDSLASFVDSLRKWKHSIHLHLQCMAHTLLASSIATMIAMVCWNAYISPPHTHTHTSAPHPLTGMEYLSKKNINNSHFVTCPGHMFQISALQRLGVHVTTGRRARSKPFSSFSVARDETGCFHSRLSSYRPKNMPDPHTLLEKCFGLRLLP